MPRQSPRVGPPTPDHRNAGEKEGSRCNAISRISAAACAAAAIAATMLNVSTIPRALHFETQRQTWRSVTLLLRVIGFQVPVPHPATRGSEVSTGRDCSRSRILRRLEGCPGSGRGFRFDPEDSGSGSGGLTTPRATKQKPTQHGRGRFLAVGSTAAKKANGGSHVELWPRHMGAPEARVVGSSFPCQAGLCSRRRRCSPWNKKQARTRRRSPTAAPPATRPSVAGRRSGHPAPPSGRRPRGRRSLPPGRQGSPRSLERPARPVRP